MCSVCCVVNLKYCGRHAASQAGGDYSSLVMHHHAGSLKKKIINFEAILIVLPYARKHIGSLLDEFLTDIYIS